MSGKRRSSGKPAARAAGQPAAAAVPAPADAPWWVYAAGLFLGLFVVFEIYQPVLHAPFLFDDLYLPFMDPAFAHRSFRDWVIGVRPLLMFTYWLNYRSVGPDTTLYHAWNILQHLTSSLLAWLIVRKLLGRVEEARWRREVVAAFCGALFLVHPLQTESVAYVASRSETLSVMLAYGALAIYLYRKSEAVSFPLALGVLALSVAGVTSKEHVAVLPGVFVLADMYWGTGPKLKRILHNWKLYAPFLAVGLAGAAFVSKVLRTASTAGFGMADLPWNHYFYTQCRAVWVYVRLLFLPYGQNIDYDFPISRSLLDHGALFGLLGIAALLAAAWYLRKDYPLASFGIVTFLLLLAPTSSVVPIKDPLVERRLYLPFIGVLLVLADFLRRLRITKAAMSAALGLVAILLCVATYSRNQVWSNPISLWQDTADKSPAKSRPRFQLAYALFTAGQCHQSVQEYRRAASLFPPDGVLLVDWALAYDCDRQYAPAVEKLKQALAYQPTAHVYSLIGMMYAKQGLTREAWEALDTAKQIGPSYSMTYVYRGNLRMTEGNWAEAATEYRMALKRNPDNTGAREGLASAEVKLRAEAQKQP